MTDSKVRVDKWLWSVRIFKTRSLASDMCRNGHVKIKGKNVKPSFLISVGDHLTVKKNGFNLEFKVNELITKRVGAPVAQKCYENLTTEEELNKYNDWFVGKARPEIRKKGEGRPTKRERREIDEYKEHQFDDDVD